MKNYLDGFDRGHLILALGFSSILLLMVLLTDQAVSRVAELNSQLQRVVSQYNHKVGLLKTMHRAARERIFTMHHMLLITDPVEKGEDGQSIDEYGTLFTRAREELLTLPLNPQEQRLLAHQGKLTGRAEPLQREAVHNIIAGDTAAARQQLLEEVIPTQHQVLASLSQLEAVQAMAIEQAISQAQQQQIAARNEFILIGGSALLLGVVIFFFSLFLARRLSHQAHHDPLTGINNRRGFELYLGKLLQRKNQQQKGYLCVMDLDHFKQVNDIAGHAAGDALLKDLVERIAKTIRRDDMFARMGGDEFAVILEGCPLKNARRVATAIRNTVYNNRFSWQQQEYRVGISIGMVSIDRAARSAAGLLAMADDACYAAKRAGRNQVHLYTDSEQGIEILKLSEPLLQPEHD